MKMVDMGKEYQGKDGKWILKLPPHNINIEKPSANEIKVFETMRDEIVKNMDNSDRVKSGSSSGKNKQMKKTMQKMMQKMKKKPGKKPSKKDKKKSNLLRAHLSSFSSFSKLNKKEQEKKKKKNKKNKNKNKTKKRRKRSGSGEDEGSGDKGISVKAKVAIALGIATIGIIVVDQFAETVTAAGGRSDYWSADDTDGGIFALIGKALGDYDDWDIAKWGDWDNWLDNLEMDIGIGDGQTGELHDGLSNSIWGCVGAAAIGTVLTGITIVSLGTTAEATVPLMVVSSGALCGGNAAVSMA